MTKEELDEKAKKYGLNNVCKECNHSYACKNKNPLCSILKNAKQIYKDAYESGYSDGYEVGKKNERELQCGKKQLENLAKVNELLKAQIEQMKCCENCADYDGTDCNADHDYDCKCFTGNKNDDDFWELKE